MTANFFMQDQNITMVQGDTLAFGIEITDQHGELMDIDEAYFTAKMQYDDTVPFFQVSTTSSTAGQISREDTGKYSVRIAPAATTERAGQEPGQYLYDLVLHKNSDVFTVMRGALTVLPGITQGGAE